MKRIETVEIDTIRSKNRVRQEEGDLSDLMNSMRLHGLLNPLTITEHRTLIAGQRRLEAARRLGWSTIQCRIIAEDNEQALLEIEIEENTTRKDFTSDEMADALLRLDRMKNPGWWRSFLNWIRKVLGKLGLRRRKR
jgi:ParB family transcriptional regulator, chromosome partitioning protein